MEIIDKRAPREEFVKGWMLDAVIPVANWEGGYYVPLREYHFKRTNILSRRKVVIVASSESIAWKNLKYSLTAPNK